jgi:uncharacterized membrane protein YeiH
MEPFLTLFLTMFLTLVISFIPNKSNVNSYYIIPFIVFLLIKYSVGDWSNKNILYLSSIILVSLCSLYLKTTLVQKLYKQDIFIDIETLLNYLGTAFFAFEGVKTSLTYNNNKFISFFFGLCTSFGGGIIRDLLNGKYPSFVYDKLNILVSFMFSYISLLIN